jgi:hypothetical protein
LASSPTEHAFTASDGAELVWYELGRGGRSAAPRPLLDADTNWIRFGHAAEIAARGFRVIMPDLRAMAQRASRTIRLPTRPTCSPATGWS